MKILDLAFNNVKLKDWYFVLDLVQFRTGLGYKHSFMWWVSRRLCGGGPCDFGVTPSPLTRIWTFVLWTWAWQYLINSPTMLTNTMLRMLSILTAQLRSKLALFLCCSSCCCYHSDLFLGCVSLWRISRNKHFQEENHIWNIAVIVLISSQMMLSNSLIIGFCCEMKLSKIINN